MMAAHIHRLSGLGVQQGNIHSHAPGMFRKIAHIVVSEHLGLVNMGIIPGLHLLIPVVSSPFANVQHGGMGTVGVINFQQVTLTIQIFRDFFQRLRRLSAQDGAPTVVTVQRTSYKIVIPGIFQISLHQRSHLVHIHKARLHHGLKGLIERRFEFPAAGTGNQ